MNFIKEITAFETFTVRQPVLRPGKPIESCHFDGDNLLTTKHFGYYLKDKLTGIISLFENCNASFDTKKQFQIRGMAILEDYQKKGIGAILVLHTENYITLKDEHLIWFNARANAVNFYKKLGYQIKGEQFEITGVGPHYLMFKLQRENHLRI